MENQKTSGIRNRAGQAIDSLSSKFGTQTAMTSGVVSGMGTAAAGAGGSEFNQRFGSAQTGRGHLGDAPTGRSADFPGGQDEESDGDKPQGIRSDTGKSGGKNTKESCGACTIF